MHLGTKTWVWKTYAASEREWEGNRGWLKSSMRGGEEAEYCKMTSNGSNGSNGAKRV